MARQYTRPREQKLCRHTNPRRDWVIVLAMSLIAACGAGNDTLANQTSTAACVPLPEGEYQFQNGVFTPVRSSVVNMQETVVDTPQEDASSGAAVASDADLARDLSAGVSGLGFDWLGLSVRGRSAILTGTAPDRTAKDAALEAGETAILEAASSTGRINIVVDGIELETGSSSLGAALLGLSDEPDRIDCEQAFARTMENRNVEFRTGSAVIQPASRRLLDATAGVASVCQSFAIEVAGHTDDIGEDLENLRLSQRRADAVRAYLIEMGVPQSALTAVGYGEERPLDVSGTREARARNRRTEFRVRNR